MACNHTRPCNGRNYILMQTERNHEVRLRGKSAVYISKKDYSSSADRND
jgi:hypothetical protein